ncbi:TetR/AcrR family transcriptional regulator [Labrys sp. 22185]|uniref:TetR/AcrR family transcriptional regulator n=1 Tax=Labrys sp. 22185 TaxID=3453888 RepID=UPI003F8367DA
MARPREFDRDEALKRATAVFWAKGFEAASTDNLLAAMKIGRQSLYDTFGDKRRLYLEALGRYQAVNLANQLAQLDAEASPLAGIRRMLLAVAEADPSFRALGCMNVGAIIEFGRNDEEIAGMLAENEAALDAALEGSLRKARAAGEIGAGTDIRGAARFIQATLRGLKVSGKAGADTQSLRQSVEFALAALTKDARRG